MAQTIPGSADVARVKPEERSFLPERSEVPAVDIQTGTQTTTPPPDAQSLHLTLHSVNINGVMVFSPEQMNAIYVPYLNHDITLDQVYRLADAVTKLYRDAGYFLSLATVPTQHIKDGEVTILVIEGYISHVDLPREVGDHSVIHAYIDHLLAQKPLTANELESFLLRLNDLPGLSFRAVLSAMENTEGGLELTLVPTHKDGQGLVSFDNYSSRFLGPNELTTAYGASLLPLQQTTISGLTR